MLILAAYPCNEHISMSSVTLTPVQHYAAWHSDLAINITFLKFMRLNLTAPMWHSQCRWITAIPAKLYLFICSFTFWLFGSLERVHCNFLIFFVLIIVLVTSYLSIWRPMTCTVTSCHNFISRNITQQLWVARIWASTIKLNLYKTTLDLFISKQFILCCRWEWKHQGLWSVARLLALSVLIDHNPSDYFFLNGVKDMYITLYTFINIFLYEYDMRDKNSYVLWIVFPCSSLLCRIYQCTW